MLTRLLPSWRIILILVFTYLTSPSLLRGYQLTRDKISVLYTGFPFHILKIASCDWIINKAANQIAYYISNPRNELRNEFLKFATNFQNSYPKTN